MLVREVTPVTRGAEVENVTERVFDTELPLLAPSTAPLALKYTETAPVVPGVMSTAYVVPLPERL